jgi:hypothetical protein
MNTEKGPDNGKEFPMKPNVLGLSRRALIASGAAAVASPVLLVPEAQAADGDPVLQGRENRTTDVTAIMKGTPGGIAIMGFMQEHGGTAVLDGTGVAGSGNDAGRRNECRGGGSNCPK